MSLKKEYRNAVRSRMMIRAAFVELLYEKPFEKVTATDIINRSGLNRSTFYAHYPDAKGVLDEITSEIVVMFRQMLTEMNFSQFLRDPEASLKKVMVFLGENQELHRLLGQSDMALVYLEQLKQELIQQVMDAPNLPADAQGDYAAQIHVRMLMSGIIDIYREWLAGKINCSLEEMNFEVSKIICAFSKIPTVK